MKEPREWPHCESGLQILPWNSMPFFRSSDYQRGKITQSAGNPSLLQLCKGFNCAFAWSFIVAIIVNPLVFYVLGQGYDASIHVKPWVHHLTVAHCLSENCLSGMVISWVDREAWERLLSLGGHGQLGGSDSKQLDIHPAPSRWECPGAHHAFPGPIQGKPLDVECQRKFFHCWR